MKKIKFILLVLLFPFLNINAKPIILQSDNVSIFNRSLEIRYIVGHPADVNFIIVDEKKYLVFNTREAAISYGENMSLKSDLTIVYVRVENVLEKEIIELSK